MPHPSSIVITGANRGIGLGLVKHYLSIPTVKHVFATARQPEKAHDLCSIHDDRLIVLKMDVECDESIKEAEKHVEKVLGNEGLNLLINNAGIYENLPNWKLSPIPREKIIKSFNVNTIGVAVVSQTFLPLLVQSASSNSSSPLNAVRGAIVNISSLYASISSNTHGSMGDKGASAYMMSKTALNQLGKIMSIDLKEEGILVVQISPGWVQTDMGGKDAALTVDESVSALITSISNLNQSHNGGFYDRFLQSAPY